jgi:hypothetical protein
VLGYVLRKLAPYGDVLEEGLAVLPLVADLDAAVVGNGEVGDGLACAGLTKFGRAGRVAGDGDRVAHGDSLLVPGPLGPWARASSKASEYARSATGKSRLF